MARYLLDANVLIDLWRNIPGCAAYLQTLHARRDILCVCDVVVAEFLSGTRPVDRVRVGQQVSTYQYLDTSRACAIQAGIWRYDLARIGVTLAIPDAIIAAVAHENGVTLITSNVRHFSMPGISTLPSPWR